MATFAEIAEIARTRFQAQIEMPESLKVVYDNAPDPHLDDQRWARFAVRPGASRLLEIGARPSYRTIGVAIAQLFHPVESGDGPGLELADIVATAFRRVTVTGLRFLVPSVQSVGRSDKWWQVNVTCPFQCDEQTT
jgi:hypothetical protein